MSKAEQFIKDYTRGCSNELCAVEDMYGKKVISYHEWLTPEQALRAVEIEREAQEEKLSKAVKLADAMYYAAQQLTTDASHLSKAMKDWWQFKNVELKKEE